MRVDDCEKCGVPFTPIFDEDRNYCLECCLRECGNLLPVEPLAGPKPDDALVGAA